MQNIAKTNHQKQNSLLKSKRFLPLFITQFFGAFNDNVFKNAFLIWFTYDIAIKTSANAEIMVSFASGLFILPFFLFSSLAGNLADKFEKAQLVKIIKFIEIIIMIFCFIGFYFENIYLLLFLLFLMGVQSAFFGPIKYSLLPLHLKDSELVLGNALIEGGTFLAILLGTIFGGVVIRMQNGIEIISLAVFLFALVGFFGSCFIEKSEISDKNLKINFNIFSQTLKIIDYAKKEKSVWLSIIGISWFWFIGISFLSQFPVFVKNIINGDEFVVTLFLAIFSIGIGVGSVLCNQLLKGKINARFVPLGSIGISVGIFIFCISSYLFIAANQQIKGDLLGINEFLSINIYSYFIILGLLIIAVFSGIYIVPLYAIMQHRSDNKYLSRIIAANNVLNALFMVIASIILVILLKINLSILQIFLMIGLVNIFIFFVILKKIIASRFNEKP